MHHNEKQFSNSNDFNPDRYLQFPKLAPEYAVGADYNNRDEFYLIITYESLLTVCFTSLWLWRRSPNMSRDSLGGA